MTVKGCGAFLIWYEKFMNSNEITSEREFMQYITEIETAFLGKFFAMGNRDEEFPIVIKVISSFFWEFIGQNDKGRKKMLDFANSLQDKLDSGDFKIELVGDALKVICSGEWFK